MGFLAAALRALRHPLRWLLTALALHALIGDFAGGLGSFSAQAAVLVGLLCGELVGRSRLRTALALPALLALGASAVLVGVLLVGVPGCTAAVGARGALHLEALLSFGGLSFAAVSGLRVLSLRYDLGRVLEALSLSACFALAFAAHRQGAVGRPLWLGDLAWSLGVDPSALLLTLAGLLGVSIAALMALEARSRLSPGALLLLPALALLMMVVGGRVAWQRDAEPQGMSRLQGEMEPSQEGESEDEGSAGEGGPQGQGEQPQGQGEQGQSEQPEGQQGDGQADAGGEEPQGGQQPQGGDQGGQEPQGGDQGGQEPQGGDQGGQQPQGGDQGGQQPQGGDQGGQQPQGGDQGGQEPQGGEQGGQEPQGGDQGGQEPQGGQQPQGGQEPQGGQQPQGGQDPQEGERQGGGGQPQEGDNEGGGGQPQDGEGEISDQESEGAQSEAEGEGDGQGSKPSNPVAVVILEDDHVPPSEVWYLRQDAWSDYSGQRMMPSPREDLDLDVLTSFPAARAELAWAPQGDARVPVRAEVSLLVEHTAPFTLDSPVAIEPIDNPNRARFVRAYAFEAMAWEGDFKELLGREAGSPDWSEAIWAAYTEAPEDPRYAELAEEMVSELPEEARSDPYAQALSMKLWLDEHMTYSTAEKHEGVPDPTGDFLFGNLTGYCTHSAHALTYLMRTRGLPARVAGGYAVEETERRGSTIVVRDHQAHAWAELYLAGQGWVPVDVSPAETLDPPAEPLDEELVEQLSQMARGEDPDQSEEDKPAPQDSPRLSLPDLTWLLEGLRGLLDSLLRTLLVLFLPLHWAVKLWRRATPRLGGQRAAPRLAYRAALDRLAEQGLRRAEGETRERFAQRVMPVSSSFSRLTELHLRAALGHPDQPPTPKHELLLAQAAVAAELRAHTPTGRWLLGLLNPFSIYGVR
ncbi:MAG: DUF4129 domain-containing protein [Alphaproteobacteria bacterium]|nr:DUF4129 domain-containing protein [Alphaproteobacteria bacterium]